MSAPISVRLPDKINSIRDNLANELHTTKTKSIKDNIVTIEVISPGHRKEIYL